MKISVETKIKDEAAKQVFINEATRKHTLDIYNSLVNVVKSCWVVEADIETAKVAISNVLFNYSKKEGKEAVKLILEDDMDVFKNETKQFRKYAQKILDAGREEAKDRIKKNNKVVNKIVKNSEKMIAALESKEETPHVFGTGVERVKKELQYRPRFVLEDLKFKLLRAVGIY